jgi:hypothetical protein
MKERKRGRKRKGERGKKERVEMKEIKRNTRKDSE